MLGAVGSGVLADGKGTTGADMVTAVTVLATAGFSTAVGTGLALTAGATGGAGSGSAPSMDADAVGCAGAS